LYAIATNITRNYHQKADTRYSENPPTEADFEANNLPLEASIIQVESAENVTRALAQLPDLHRAVIVLFYYEELSQKDIAAILEIPVGTVKSRLSIGLKRLRATIEAMEE
jgi:RNA polymerase sigma-70 factor (ECF subfamily)